MSIVKDRMPRNDQLAGFAQPWPQASADAVAASVVWTASGPEGDS